MICQRFLFSPDLSPKQYLLAQLRYLLLLGLDRVKNRLAEEQGFSHRCCSTLFPRLDLLGPEHDIDVRECQVLCRMKHVPGDVKETFGVAHYLGRHLILQDSCVVELQLSHAIPLGLLKALDQAAKYRGRAKNSTLHLH